MKLKGGVESRMMVRSLGWFAKRMVISLNNSDNSRGRLKSGHQGRKAVGWVWDVYHLRSQRKSFRNERNLVTFIQHDGEDALMRLMRVKNRKENRR